MPVDLEWPRRAIVGAIVVIGVTRPATFAEGPGVLYCGETKDRQGRSLKFIAPVKLPGPTEKSDDCAIIDLTSNSGLSVFNPICEAAATQMRL